MRSAFLSLQRSRTIFHISALGSLALWKNAPALPAGVWPPFSQKLCGWWLATLGLIIVLFLKFCP